MTLEPLDFHPRTRLVYGPGTLARIGELARELGATRVLLVTDPGIVAAGHVDTAVSALGASRVEVHVFDSVEENPTTRHVEHGVRVARELEIDFLVGLGGGSAMDCAKGINFLFSCGGEMKDYWGVGKANRPMLPMIAVPTTAGTGSETQSFALISDPDSHQKMACGDPNAACRVALLDPELTLSQPLSVTAATGIDALSHAVESYVTRRRQPFSMAWSRQAWILLSQSFERVLQAPDDLEARGAMLLGASLAGMAIENSMLGAAHSAANPLTAHFGVVHGNAVGVVLPHVVRYNNSAVANDYAELARLAGEDVSGVDGGGEALAACLTRFLARSGQRTRLEDCGVLEERLEDLAQDAAGQWTAQFNPRPVTAKDFLEIYRCAW